MIRLIKRNYFLLISLFLIFYFGFNLVSGERGLFSYIEKKETLSNLKKEELSLINKIEDLDHKNSLLSTNLSFIANFTLLVKKTYIWLQLSSISIIRDNS